MHLEIYKAARGCLADCAMTVRSAAAECAGRSGGVLQPPLHIRAGERGQGLLQGAGGRHAHRAPSAGPRLHGHGARLRVLGPALLGHILELATAPAGNIAY